MPRVAEYVEVTHLQAYFLSPEVEIILVYTWDIGYYQREHRGCNQYVATGGMAA